MPFSTNGKRDMKKEKAYQAKPQQRKNRSKRNKARQAAIKSGKVKVGDKKHLDHIKPLSKGGSNSKSNTRVISAKANLKKSNKTIKKKTTKKK